MSAELGQQFVDTNIFVYAHDRSAGSKHERARSLVRSLWDSRRGCLSVQVLEEFYVAITQKVPKPLGWEVVHRLVSDLAAWHVHVPDAQDVLAAIEIQHLYRINFWDAMIVRSASRLGCALLWSEDLNPGQVYEGIEVRNPFAG